jgi:hypothetical protein
MASQGVAPVKIKVTGELFEKAATCNDTWGELHDAIENHLGVKIGPNLEAKEK